MRHLRPGPPAGAALVLVAALAALAPACGARATPASPSGVVVFRGDVAGAVLWVDGRFIGPVDAFPGGVRVDPGEHRFELRRDDHFTHFEAVTVTAGERREVVVELAPMLP